MGTNTSFLCALGAGFGCFSVLRWANPPCLLWPRLLLLRLFYRAKSKAPAGEQISRGFWLLPSCLPALLSSGANLHSFPMLYLQEVTTSACLFLRAWWGQALGVAAVRQG